MRPEHGGDGEVAKETPESPRSPRQRAEPHFDARVVFEDAAAVVVVTGEIDPLTAPTLDEAIRRAEDYRPRVVVDMSACTFMDSSGLEVLVGAHQRTEEADRAFVVRSPHAFVARVLEISGVDDLLVVEPGPAAG